MPIPTLPGITAQTISTPRITTRVLFSGSSSAIPVVFVHGNASSATFWEEIMLGLPPEFRAIAPDQRGYGDADKNVKIDATRGMGDLADDLIALLDVLNIAKAHFVAHSLGGSVMWRVMMDYPDRILSVTQVAPGSPYGFCGTKDVNGTPNYDDFAGSGGGVVNPTFAQRLGANDRTDDMNDPLAPRTVMNSRYWKPPFRPPREEDLLSSMNSEHVGGEQYPGDYVPSSNWPGTAPGVWGPINALSPKYAGDVSKLYRITPKPDVLLIWGSDDQIISDFSFSDIGTLGKLGFIPGYPGEEVVPPQPMVSQTKDVMRRYVEAGGNVSEHTIPDTGHTPYIEKPADFNALLHPFLRAH